jgi:hypothetical protein
VTCSGPAPGTSTAWLNSACGKQAEGPLALGARSPQNIHKAQLTVRRPQHNWPPSSSPLHAPQRQQHQVPLSPAEPPRPVLPPHAQ